MQIVANGLATRYELEGPAGASVVTLSHSLAAMARTMHERIAGSTLTVLPKAAQCSCVETAPAFNRALLDFLARVA